MRSAGWEEDLIHGEQRSSSEKAMLEPRLE